MRIVQVRALELACVCWLATTPQAGTAAELKQKTLEAYEHYVRVTEARIDAELRHGNPFLWVDTLPSDRREAAYAQLQQGKSVIEPLETREAGKEIKIPDGMVHHWVGTVFIPGATLAETLALVQDYDNHEKVYQPDVLESKLLAREGNHFKVYMRFYKKKVLTAVLNTEHDIRYRMVDAERAYSRSTTTRIAEVENPGEPNEGEKPVGNARGLLWRLWSTWRFQEKDGGAYVQVESISLTRDVPPGLGWLIGPFIR
ncbi:MAG: hypothetical protein HY653_00640, partial [Acidobacteria bacterium]|nr:hypothetical protein [Acidobacteriota bacterium]